MFIILFILGIVSNAFPGIVPMGSYTLNGIEHGWYYILQALSFIFIILGINYYDKSNKIHRELLYCTIGLAFNNIADELFFNPLRLELNELIFASFIILWTTVKLWKIKTSV